MNDLSGKTILITGAASGIGCAAAQRCAASGAQVIGADLLDAAAATGLEAPHRHVLMDVTDADSIAAALAGLGPVHGLVNAAGIVGMGALAGTEPAAWRKVMDVNLDGVMLVCKQVTTAMLEQGVRGSVVNLSSAYGQTGGPGNISYNVSKTAVWQLTRCLAADLGAIGIRVNAVSPGYIETPMTDMLKQAGPFRDHFIAMHLLRRPGQPDEVAAAICFLLSDDASYITGANLAVDGGFTAAHMPVMGA